MLSTAQRNHNSTHTQTISSNDELIIGNHGLRCVSAESPTPTCVRVSAAVTSADLIAHLIYDENDCPFAVVGGGGVIVCGVGVIVVGGGVIVGGVGVIVGGVIAVVGGVGVIAVVGGVGVVGGDSGHYSMLCCRCNRV